MTKMTTYVTGLTEDTTPDGTADLVAVYDNSGTAMKKVKLNNLPAGAGSGDMKYADIQVLQLVNEIKGWPPTVNTGDLDALNLWWDKVGTPTTAPTIQDTSAAGLTDYYELCLKVVADAASEGMYQRFTYADEPRVKSGRKLSTLWAIWCVGGVGVTLSLLNQTAEETAAAKVTAAAWTIVEVPNHTLAGTYCDIKLVTDGAGTFYAVPLGANIGARGFPLGLRPTRWIDDVTVTTVVNGVDPNGSAGIDVDCTASTSPLCTVVELNCFYTDATGNGKHLMIKRKGATNFKTISANAATGVGIYPYFVCPVDDGQNFTWKTDAAAGDNELTYISVQGFWEWA
jgi:hypothetical protein